MLKFREKVLEPFAEEAKIKLIDYYSKKGMTRSDPAENYGYDTVDDIIYEIAKGLRKKKQLFDTFGFLYHCYQIVQVREFLGSSDGSSKIKSLDRNTVLKYQRQAIKFIHDTVKSSKKLKNEIIENLKKEYDKASNKKCS